MSQRRSRSPRRNRSGTGKRISNLLGNILVELIGFATLLVVLFFVNTNPAENVSSRVNPDRPATVWRAGNEFGAYASELLGIPLSFPN